LRGGISLREGAKPPLSFLILPSPARRALYSITIVPAGEGIWGKVKTTIE
jgi:hypothetical protein